MKATLEATVRGTDGLTLISGEGGVGRTAIASATAKLADARGIEPVPR